ncbi:MAG: ELWxxDGT repeat protein [Nocardioidaceae bacterium]
MTLSACAPSTAGSFPNWLTPVGEELFFTANDNLHGEEVWRSDGTHDGTVLVRDIDPHAGWYEERYTAGPEGLLNVGGTLFFSEYHSPAGRALWKTDGSRAGTVMVADPDPSTTDSYYTGPKGLRDVAGTLFFLVDRDDLRELWKSDGTTPGTTLVTQLPGEGFRATELTGVGDTLFFTASDETHGRELWKSDGTEAGTVMVKDIAPGADDSGLFDLTAEGDALFFNADDGAQGRELWRSDGTEAGTVMVADIRPGSAGSDASWMETLDGAVFFDARDGVHGNELWVSDGSAAGTHMVKDLSSSTRYAPDDLTPLGGRMFFTLGTQRTDQLWSSDGSEDGTTLVRTVGGPHETWGLTATSARLFFRADDGIHGPELWTSDGTTDGTSLVRDISDGAGFWEHGQTHHPRRGTITLFFEAFKDGRLTLSPVDGSPVRRVVRDVRRGSGPEVVLRPTRAGMRELRRALRRAHHQGQQVGRLDVTVRVTYTPCGLPSSSKLRHYTLKLR